MSKTTYIVKSNGRPLISLNEYVHDGSILNNFIDTIGKYKIKDFILYGSTISSDNIELILEEDNHKYYDITELYVCMETHNIYHKDLVEAIVEMTISKDEFKKFDIGKLQYNLIPPEMTKALAKVLTYGAEKYDKDNWKLCDDKDRYLNAMFRHLEEYRAGNLIDENSGYNNIDMVFTNVGFLVYFEQQGKQDVK